MAHDIIGIHKEGSIILLTLNDRPTPIKYDCRDGSLTSFTGRRVTHFPNTCCKGGDLTYPQRWAVDTIISKVEYGDDRGFRKLELFINVLDLIEDVYSIPDECPQGYIKWVKDNNKFISNSTLLDFLRAKEVEKMSKEDREVYDKLMTTFCNSDGIVVWWIGEKNSLLRQKFRQIFKTSMKTFTWDLRSDLICWYRRVYCQGLAKYVYGDKWVEMLDGNRSFKHCIQELEELKDKARNDSILANENLIRPITEIAHNDLIIIVPSALEEFTVEGQQQNNCVGSYYHNNMARGDDFIYFIRKKENPSRSYITNRYNFRAKNTVESKVVNNHKNNDIEAITLIKEIDVMIRQLLKDFEPNTKF